ncbi:MAG TPA: DEAD/DEAH box helicase, partial [Pirellula sp.]|nr:DEAD/DEAH box helicase [Pirellula sp.]
MSSKEPTIAISAHQDDFHKADFAEASLLIASLEIEDTFGTDDFVSQSGAAQPVADQPRATQPTTAKPKRKKVKPIVEPIECVEEADVKVKDELVLENSQRGDLQKGDSAEMTEEHNKVEVDTRVKFSDFNLPAEICSALLTSGYEFPTAIQAATIPAMLEGRDVLGQAQTGTGKTAAFALPLLSRINIQNPATQVLVLAPTRELAIQVSEFFQRYAQHMRGLRVAPIYG